MSTIVQGPPTTNSTSTLASPAFIDQLQAVSGFSGPIAYTQTTGGTHLTVSSTGRVSTTGALTAGTYTATGTTADGSADTGTFTYTLTVATANSLGMPSYSMLGTPSGGTAGAITFNSNTPDLFGSYYFLDGDLTGWDSPDMRMSMLPKIGNDVNAEGEIAADLHYRGRSLQFVLFVECTSEANRENSKQLLAKVCNTSAMTFTVNEDVPKQISCVRAGNTNQGKLTMVDQGRTTKQSVTTPVSGTQWGVPNGTNIFPFKATVEVYSEDPFKYAVTPIVLPFSAGAISLTNPGTYPSMNALISFIGTGGSGPITISTPERAMVLKVPAVPAGAPALGPIPNLLYIDLYDKLIYDPSLGPLFGNSFYLRDMRTPWLRIPTGATTLTTSPAQPGSLTMHAAYL
jgi:hypothetical protein